MTISRRVFATALLVGLRATAALAGPVHDPFLELYQVGTWRGPDGITLLAGYPAELLTPARVDSAWVSAAGQVLDRSAAGSAAQLTVRLSRLMAPLSGGEDWLSSARAALADLAAGRVGPPEMAFLRAERLTMAFGVAAAGGDYDRAAELSARMLAATDTLGLAARDRLVWELRLRLTTALAGGSLPATGELWPYLTELEPFDAGNAWAMWVAHRRSLDLPLLPQDGDQPTLGSIVRGVPKAWLTPAELYASALPAEWQAGLGAIILDTLDLAAHFVRFPQPPADFSRQGWWVQGKRRLSRGQAVAYEELAGRQDLSADWRLDVWRRASELRLLKGAWPEGLADLTAALELAKQGHGTRSLRQRLREWTEQALVLALAHNDVATARRVDGLGRDHFTGEEGAAFAREVATWQNRLDAQAPAPEPAGTDILDLARLRVTMGQAAPMQSADDGERSDFLVSADRQLWDVWYKWGVALAAPEPVAGERRARAIAYRAALRAGQSAPPGSEAMVDSALAAVALRLGDRPWAGELLGKAVDVDAGRLCGWQSPPAVSLLPGLLPQVRGSELDRHALLGFCLAAGDMRGILGLAYELPARGLTRAEKRLFLYPFPAVGPIREALVAADNDPALLLAVARNESLFEPAVRSRAGALGWMQIMPFHYPDRGAQFGPGNWRIPAVSIRRGDALLTENRRRYDDDPYRVLAAYNAGPEAAARWDAQLGGQAPADIYLAWIGYPETRAYVEKVLIDREIYTAIIGAGHAAPATASPNE